DDIAIFDPMFFQKRRAFDSNFPAHALLQPNRYAVRPDSAIQKLYVDYRISSRVTSGYQNLEDTPLLRLPLMNEAFEFARTRDPCAGCFLLSAAQLVLGVHSPAYAAGDIWYVGPLHSAATLSIIKSFRVYKPVLKQAWFLEVLHTSPRWIPFVSQQVQLRS